MKSRLNRDIVYFYSTSFFFVFGIGINLYSMESENITSSLHEQALRIALTARPDLFNRKMVAALSQVNNSFFKQVLETMGYREKYGDCRALVLQSQEKRKEYFLNKYPHLRTISGLVWNEYETACACVSAGSGLNLILYPENRPNGPYGNRRELMIECRYIWDSGHNLIYRVWDLFINTLSHQPCVFFKHAYEVYFHGYGQLDEILGDHVLEYNLRSIGVSDAKICLTDIGGAVVPLTVFLEFPVALQAILQSKVTEYRVGGLYKTFLFEGVKIPENYDRYQKYFPVPRYSSFQRLPKKIRKAIVERYKAQYSEMIATEEKNSKKWGCFG
jgi:hypothetical protein